MTVAPVWEPDRPVPTQLTPETTRGETEKEKETEKERVFNVMNAHMSVGAPECSLQRLEEGISAPHAFKTHCYETECTLATFLVFFFSLSLQKATLIALLWSSLSAMHISLMQLR